MKSEPAYLRHILDEIDFLPTEVATVSFEQFLSDETLTRACARSLEVVGEASKNVPDSFQQLYPEVDRRRLTGMRDKIVHHYFGVNRETVRDVVMNRLPELKAQVIALLDAETSS